MKTKKFKLKDDSQKDINRSMSYLRKQEKHADLNFVCKSNKIVGCHKALFKPLSSFLDKLFDICQEKQPYEPVYITIDDVPVTVMNKLIESMYLGQTTITRKERSEVEGLIEQLGLNLKNLKYDESSDDESSEEEKPKKFTKKSHRIKVATSDSDDDSIASSAKAPAAKKSAKPPPSKTSAMDSKLKKEAEEDKFKPKLTRVEDSKDADVKKYYKPSSPPEAEKPTAKKMVSNPFHKAAPQKRRLTDSDKKVVSKASKKPRQEDSSSADDSDREEAMSARKKEIPASAKVRARKPSDSSDESEPRKVRRSSESSDKSSVGAAPSPPPPTKAKAKPKPGPKKSASKAGPAAKRVANGSAAKSTPIKTAVESIHCDLGGDSIICCDECDKIFVSKAAFANHRKEHHAGKQETSSENEAPKEVKNNKPGPRNKKSKAKIAEERNRKSKKNSDSDSDDNDDVKAKADPKSPKEFTDEDDSDSDEKPAKKIISPKLTPKRGGAKAGPASKLKKPDVSKKLELSSDASSDEGDDKVSKRPPNKVKVNFSASKPSPASQSKERRSSSAASDNVSKGPYRCRFCTQGCDKPGNLKNHVLNHFKDELLKVLPSCLPFLCPVCHAPSRDKITLLRHFAFGHKKVFEICPESDFQARPKDHPIKEVPKGSISDITTSNSPNASKKPKPGPKKSKKADSDSEDIPTKKKANSSPQPSTSKDNSSADEATENSKSEDKTKAISAITEVHFSSDDDDFSSTTVKAKETNFDDLFNSLKDDDEKKSEDKSEEKQNGDHDGDDNSKDSDKHDSSKSNDSD